MSIAGIAEFVRNGKSKTLTTKDTKEHKERSGDPRS